MYGIWFRCAGFILVMKFVVKYKLWQFRENIIIQWCCCSVVSTLLSFYKVMLKFITVITAIFFETFRPNFTLYQALNSKQFLQTFYGLGQNFCSFFHFLVQFLLNTSETKLNYYHHKLNVWDSWRVAERLKTFKKIPEMVRFDGKYPADYPKAKFWRFTRKNCKISHVKHSIEKPVLLNYLNLFTIFRPILYIYQSKHDDKLNNKYNLKTS